MAHPTSNPPLTEAMRISRLVGAPLHELLVEVSRLTKRPIDPVFIKLMRRFGVQCFELGVRDALVRGTSTIPAPALPALPTE